MPAVENLRSLALLGHAGCGKTTLIESLLALAGAINQAGAVERGTTVCDYDPLEKEHQHTAKLAVAHLEREGVLVQLLDTPGFPDFAGQAIGALDAVESVITVINPQNGIEISASRAMLWGRRASCAAWWWSIVSTASGSICRNCSRICRPRSAGNVCRSTCRPVKAVA